MAEVDEAATSRSRPAAARGRLGAVRAMADSHQFASPSLPRHLARGAVGFGGVIGGLALIPVLGFAALVLVPVGLVALRGCPMCWTMGLIQTLSAGRLRRECADGRCELRVPDRASQG